MSTTHTVAAQKAKLLAQIAQQRNALSAACSLWQTQTQPLHYFITPPGKWILLGGMVWGAYLLPRHRHKMVRYAWRLLDYYSIIHLLRQRISARLLP